MSALLISSLAFVGTIGGFFAGLLGFGGGVVMFPLLFYVPPLLGLERLDAKTVAAVVMTQVFFSTLVGGVAHLHGGRVHGRIALTAGISSAMGSFLGGVASKWTSERFLLLLFGIATLVVLAMMLLPTPEPELEKVSLEKVAVATVPLSLCSFIAGILIGFLGAGNFVFVPLLIYILRVPTRIAIGSSLVIALMNTGSGFLGKLATGQIPWLVAMLVVIGAGIGALAGERVHRQVPAPILRYVYGAMVALIALRVWLTIFDFVL
jgi:uncharacterized membrane protein YfcA